MLTNIIHWLLECKAVLQSISISDIIGSQWIGTGVTMWDILVILFLCGTLVTTFFPFAADEDDLFWDSEDL